MVLPATYTLIYNGIYAILPLLPAAEHHRTLASIYFQYQRQSLASRGAKRVLGGT